MQERVTFHSAGGRLPVNVLDAEHSEQNWRIFNAEFGIALPNTWYGEVLYTGRQEAVADDTVFCSMPGELHTTPRIHRPGSFSVLLFPPDVFASYIAERGLTRGAWKRAFARVSPEVLRNIANVLRVSREETSDLEAQSAIVDLFDVALPELFDAGSHGTLAAVSDRTAKRMRECLHADVSGALDLESLAAQCGTNKFHALRSFKRRYGVPPHAYHLCLKVSMARCLLAGGYSATQIATRCGFTDRSHFGRMFRRSLGVTPASYGAALHAQTLPMRTVNAMLSQSDSGCRAARI